MELLLYASVRIEDIRWLSFRNYLQIKGNIGFYGDQSSVLEDFMKMDIWIFFFNLWVT